MRSLLALGLMVAAEATSADEISYIDSCGASSTVNNEMLLVTADIQATGPQGNDNPCIAISHEHVTLDCQGYTLVAPSPPFTTLPWGIAVFDTPYDVTLRNCKLEGWWMSIYYEGQYGLIESIEIIDGGFGIVLGSADGNEVHVAYVSDVGGSSALYYTMHDGFGWLRPELLDQEVARQSASIAVPPGGGPVIAYQVTDGAAEGNLEVLLARREERGWQMDRIGAGGSESSRTALAVDAAGFAHLIYDSESGQVRYVREGDDFMVVANQQHLVGSRIYLDGNRYPHTLLGTDDVAVSIDATHYCVKSRGVMDSSSQTSTTALGGCFERNIHTRAEFLNP